MSGEYVHRLPIRNVFVRLGCHGDARSPQAQAWTGLRHRLQAFNEFSGPLSPLADAPVMASLPRLLNQCRAGWGTLSGDMRQSASQLAFECFQLSYEHMGIIINSTPEVQAIVQLYELK